MHLSDISFDLFLTFSTSHRSPCVDSNYICMYIYIFRENCIIPLNSVSDFFFLLAISKSS